MEFYIGGYYLIEETPIKDWMTHDLLPAKIMTPSSCICNLHPDDICLSWVKGDKKVKNAYREKLGITKEQFAELQKEIDELFNLEKYGWEQVFCEVEHAKKYYQKWLTKIPNIKLVAIATTEKHREIFLAEEKQEGENAGSCGTWLLLKNKLPIDINQGLLGYEVLGFETGGFHSFICNSLENDFSNKLSIKFNDKGLISSYKDADKAADYAQNPDVGAETALWQPWAIVELSKNVDMNYPCPCCGYLTFDEEPCGTFEICPVCYWEDDNVQNSDPAYDGGANGISLNKAKENFAKHEGDL